jgi:hypothetical protein
MATVYSNLDPRWWVGEDKVRYWIPDWDDVERMERILRMMKNKPKNVGVRWAASREYIKERLRELKQTDFIGNITPRPAVIRTSRLDVQKAMLRSLLRIEKLLQRLLGE